MSSHFHLRLANNIIQNDGVITYPTESVYGLGCNPLSVVGVEKILRLKQRSAEKGLIMVASSLQQLSNYIDLDQNEADIILNYKSPMTWLVNKSTHTPPWICGKHSKVAIRISSHPLVISLCNLINQPVVSTSANPAGFLPARNVHRARLYFGDCIDFYLSGNTGTLKQPTPITDIKTNKIIRDS